MAAIGTLPVLFATGTHASLPAASAVGKGGLYSCTTHSLVYQTDGSSWTTWATLTGTGLSDPMTTRGDVIVRNSSNTTARLGVGAAGKFLTSDGTDVAYGQGPLTTTGDLIIGATGGTPTRLAAGATSGHVLTSNGSGAAPSWQAAAGGGSGVSWTQDLSEAGTSFTNFTAASGTWSSNGTEIIQTDTSGSWRRAKYNTLIPLGFPTIMEAEVFIITSTGRASLGITDGTNAGGLSVAVQEGVGIQIDFDATNTIRTFTATVNTSTWYKLRVVIGSTWMSAYLDGSLIGNLAIGRSVTWDVNAQYLTLLSYAGSVKFRNIKAWTLTGGAPT